MTKAVLTNRERQVMMLIPLGLSNKQIGLALSLTEKTIKHHVMAIMRKLKAANRAHVAAIAVYSYGAHP